MQEALSLCLFLDSLSQPLGLFLSVLRALQIATLGTLFTYREASILHIPNLSSNLVSGL